MNTEPVALVTGANQGIGAATAVALAREGCAVLCTYKRLELPEGEGSDYDWVRAQDCSSVLSAIEAEGRNGTSVELDLASVDDVSDLFDRAEADLGPVTILVNNASGWVADTFDADHVDGLGRPVASLTADTFDQVMSVDARGAALLTAEFARRHRLHDLDWGRIVSLTSGSRYGFPGEVSYGAAKAALENLTMSAAFELAEQGITANIVHPPVTDTGWVDDAVREVVARDPHLIHVAEPEQVAEVISWLCSDAARLVTGNRIELR